MVLLCALASAARCARTRSLLPLARPAFPPATPLSSSSLRFVARRNMATEARVAARKSRRAAIGAGYLGEVHALTTAESYNLGIVQDLLGRQRMFQRAPLLAELQPAALHLRIDSAPSGIVIGDAGVKSSSTPTAEAIIQAGPGEIFVFRTGSIVCWGIPEVHIHALRTLLRGAERNPLPAALVEQEREVLSFTVEPGESSRLDRSRIVLCPRLSEEDGVVATAMAASSKDEAHGGEEGDEGEWSGAVVNARGPRPATRRLDADLDPVTLREQQNDNLIGAMVLEQFAFSHALAASVELGVLESNLIDYATKVEWIPGAIRDGRPLAISREAVLEHYGELMRLRHAINVTYDLANFYWDRDNLERLFDRTATFLDMASRRRICNERLNYHSELAELLRITLSERHSTKLEWGIIGLITIEVLFELLHYAERLL